MPDNIFDDLGVTLTDFRTCLDSEIAVIQPAVAALRTIVPDQIDGLIDGLAELLAGVSLRLQQLDTSADPGIAETAGLAPRVGAHVDAARPLLPHMSARLDKLAGHSDVIGGLPAVEPHVAGLPP